MDTIQTFVDVAGLEAWLREQAATILPAELSGWLSGMPEWLFWLGLGMVVLLALVAAAQVLAD